MFPTENLHFRKKNPYYEINWTNSIHWWFSNDLWRDSVESYTNLGVASTYYNNKPNGIAIEIYASNLLEYTMRRIKPCASFFDEKNLFRAKIRGLPYSNRVRWIQENNFLKRVGLSEKLRYTFACKIDLPYVNKNDEFKRDRFHVHCTRTTKSIKLKPQIPCLI